MRLGEPVVSEGEARRKGLAWQVIVEEYTSSRARARPEEDPEGAGDLDLLEWEVERSEGGKEGVGVVSRRISDPVFFSAVETVTF